MRRSIKERRARRRIKRQFDLQLTSLMDMLIIIVVFMLKSYSASTSQFTTSQSIKLPTSSSEEMPVDSPSLIIEPAGIIFDNEKVVEFVAVAPTSTPTYEIDTRFLSDHGRRILPLYDALVKAREKAEVIRSKAVWKDKNGKTVEAPKFQGTVIIQADKTLKYDLLKKIMYTAGAAEYKIFKLAGIKKDL